MDEAVKKKVQELLLKEVKTGKLLWYYVSMHTKDDFIGAVFIEARGPTEAWTLLHRLGLFVEGCGTETIGPITKVTLGKVPPESRYKVLTKEELKEMFP